MHDLRRSLGNIVDDLWGTAPAPKTAEPQVAAEAVPAFPPFEQLWKTVDETVDWTEVLAHDTPSDGLTSPETWAQYRLYADRVLAGDPEAYLSVLKTADPLKDLTPWAEKFDTVCVDADTLRVAITAVPALALQDGQRYLAGLSLRAARDLFALLPIVQVEATALCRGEQRLHVAFERRELQKVRFGFIDPVEFVIQCGGVFTSM